MSLLKLDHVTKRFEGLVAVNDISMEIQKNRIHALIGPNGAGKTTTIKLILGLQSITKGEVKINGYDIQKDFTKAIAKVGTIVENPDLYMYLTGRENLKLIANLYKEVDNSRIDEVIKLVKLENRIDDKVSKYSLGMRQRLGIAQALLHAPNLLILDEPTNGLDPEGIKELRDLLKTLAEQENMAILISSHNLAELETFCNKVSIIKNGVIIETNNVADIKNSVGEKRIIEVNNTDEIITILEKYKDKIEIIDKKHFSMTIEKDEVPEVVKTLVNKNLLVYGVRKQKVTLEDAFLKKTGGNIID